MSSMVAALTRRPLPIFPKWGARIWWACVIMGLVLALAFCGIAVYASGWGGYISEKLIARDGVGGSNLLIERGGVATSGLDVGMSGVLTSPSVTGMYIDAAETAHATLHANLTTLNGFPQATVYFEWGYDTGYGNATAPQVVAATGDVTADIQGFDPSRGVYYRGVVEADGRNYSSGSSFLVGTSGAVTGFNLLNAVVLIVYIAMVLFVVIALGRASTVAVLVLMAVAIYLGEALVVAIQEALRHAFGG